MKENNDIIKDFLNENGIMPTPVRILIYKCLANSNTPLSLAEIETKLESVDKSTISRTLSTFRNFNLIHSFNDGSGSVKYEICSSVNNPREDQHVHFHCIKCHTTTCFNDISIPLVQLPQGFSIQEINYIISGICKNCSES